MKKEKERGTYHLSGIGPGQYYPSIDFTKKKPQTCGWSQYRGNRIPPVQPYKEDNPGPDMYNQQ